MKGPKCIDTDLPCDFVTSTCNGRNEKCIGFGPGDTTYESNQIIGQRQFEAARDLYESAQTFLSGNTTISYRHTYVDMQVNRSQSHFFSSIKNSIHLDYTRRSSFYIYRKE